MKTIKLAILFLLSPIVFFGQTLTGLWTGSVHNDSTTIRKDASFEIVLTQYKDKVYGYSRSTFTVHDSLFYIVKRVKGTIDGDVCEVKDDDIISNNFQGRLDKGVKMVSTFHFDHQDSIWRMDGDWKTNKTKKYYSVSGKIALAQEKDLTKSKIFPHLEELKLASDVAFYNDYKKASEPVAVTSPPAKVNKQENAIVKSKPANPPSTEVSQVVAQTKQPDQQETPAEIKQDKTVASANANQKNNIAPVTSGSTAQTKQPQPINPDVTTAREEKVNAPVVKQTTSAPPTQNPKNNDAIAQNKPAAVITNSPPVTDTKTTNVKAEPGVAETIATAKPAETKKQPEAEQKSGSNNKETVAAVSAPDKPQSASLFTDSKPATTSTAAAFVSERKIAPPQVVNFVSDSLELALYDNGEVDGDTVSVLLNGEIILAKQGLKVSAIKKTIYAPAGKDDSMTLVLYAENLGKYPPNTGLLIIHDGDETYQVRFSADLTQNAAVIFKRKRN